MNYITSTCSRIIKACSILLTANVGCKEIVRNTIAFLLLCAVQVNAFASDDRVRPDRPGFTTDTERVIPDRPGFTTGTYTAKPGNVIVELGYQYAFGSNDNDQSTQTLPLMDLRIGLTPKIELDLLWDGWNTEYTENQPSDTSVADVSIGGKYRIYKSSIYNLTMFGLLSLPVGSSPSTSDSVDPLLGLLWDYSLNSKVGLFGEALADSYTYAGDRTYEAQLAIGAAFRNTDRITTFIEIYGILPSEAKLNDETVIDGGVSYLYRNHTRLDASVGVGLNDTSDNFIGFGIATLY
jgi:hypothetical protein